VFVLLVQRLEERHTVIDDEGKQTTVTRTVDGQTVRQTRIQKKNGEQETTEDLINMDESRCTESSVIFIWKFFLILVRISEQVIILILFASLLKIFLF